MPKCEILHLERCAESEDRHEAAEQRIEPKHDAITLMEVGQLGQVSPDREGKGDGVFGTHTEAEDEPRHWFRPGITPDLRHVRCLFELFGHVLNWSFGYFQ